MIRELKNERDLTATLTCRLTASRSGCRTSPSLLMMEKIRLEEMASRRDGTKELERSHVTIINIYEFIKSRDLKTMRRNSIIRRIGRCTTAIIILALVILVLQVYNLFLLYKMESREFASDARGESQSMFKWPWILWETSDDFKNPKVRYKILKLKF